MDKEKEQDIQRKEKEAEKQREMEENERRWKPELDSLKWNQKQTRMWANAQPDGRPVEHRLGNAAEFG